MGEGEGIERGRAAREVPVGDTVGLGCGGAGGGGGLLNGSTCGTRQCEQVGREPVPAWAGEGHCRAPGSLGGVQGMVLLSQHITKAVPAYL